MAYQISRRRSSVHPLTTMQREMDHLMNHLFGAPVGSLVQQASSQLVGFQPRIDVADRGDRIEIEAELPGIGPEDIEITFDDGRLTLRGEKRDENSEEREGYWRSERSFGSFQRSFELPDPIHEDQIEATFDQGILCVRLPKVVPQKSGPRTIAIGRSNGSKQEAIDVASSQRAQGAEEE